VVEAAVASSPLTEYRIANVEVILSTIIKRKAS